MSGTIPVILNRLSRTNGDMEGVFGNAWGSTPGSRTGGNEKGFGRQGGKVVTDEEWRAAKPVQRRRMITVGAYSTPTQTE